MSGPGLMARMREQSVKFGTDVQTEKNSKVVLSSHLWVEGTEEEPSAAITDES
jgi:hypothetical protein